MSEPTRGGAGLPMRGRWGLGRAWARAACLLALLWAGPAGGQTAEEVEEVFWQSVVCEDAVEMRLYLEEYPGGTYEAEARACLEAGLGLDQAARRLVQRGLAAVGQAPGPADGLFGGPGAQTREAIREWQKAKRLEATGYVTGEQAAALMELGRAAAQEAAQAAEEQAAQEAARADDAAYAEAERTNTAEGYGAYLAAYPTGQHAATARERQAAREEAERWRAGRTFRDSLRSGGTGPEMVVVPAGTYQMGSPSYEGGRDDDEGPVHQVTIAEPFAVGVYEVRREEYAQFVEATGYAGGNACWTYEGGEWADRAGRSWRDAGYRQSGQHPVVCVNWEDARAYAAWLSRQTGQGYRLLSEAEWEYVARGGTATARYWGEGETGQCRHANGADATAKREHPDWTTVACTDGHARTAPVGSYAENGYGLYDVLGNVWEWVADCWHESYEGAPRDGQAWTGGDCSRRVLRGGSWSDVPGFLRSAIRLRYTAGSRYVSNGFRIARSLD